MPTDWSRLFGVRWVHVFEEDTAAGAVFRPDTSDIPLSRRPRRSFDLAAERTARLYSGGADDRPVAHPGRWREVGKTLELEFDNVEGTDVRLQIIGVGKDRLVVTQRR